MKTIFLMLGAGLPTVGGIVYVISILRKQSRPQRTTRLLLVIISVVASSALWAGHDRAALWLALVASIEAVTIWALSFRYGIGGRGRLDVLCFILCAAGIVLWLLSGRSTLGLLMAVVADLTACLPSLYKTYRLPHTESLPFYLMGSSAGLLVALASAHTFAALLYPLYILAIDGLFAVIIVLRRRQCAAFPTDKVTGKRILKVWTKFPFLFQAVIPGRAFMRFIPDDDTLTLELEGFEKFWALRPRLVMQREAITAVNYKPQLPAMQDFWGYLRMPGTNIPWRFLAGTFWRKGNREFWYIRLRTPGVLQIDFAPDTFQYARVRLSCDPETAQEVADWWHGGR